MRKVPCLAILLLELFAKELCRLAVLQTECMRLDEESEGARTPPFSKCGGVPPSFPPPPPPPPPWLCPCPLTPLVV